MQEIINIFIKSIFIDNMIFAFFLGMCSYLAVSKTVKTSMGLGTAVLFVLVVTVPINYLINKYILVEGALTWISPSFADIDLSFLSFIIFIAVVAAIVQLVEMFIEKVSPSLYSQLGILTVERNIPIIKGSGIVVFLNRDISILLNAKTANRPLIRGGREAVLKLYAERIETYRKCADLIVNPDSAGCIGRILDYYKRITE